jgi:hypothetical protein
MESNKAFARNELPPAIMKNMWNELTKELNLQKGEARLMESWRKVRIIFNSFYKSFIMFIISKLLKVSSIHYLTS